MLEITEQFELIMFTANVVLIVECRTFQTDFTKHFKLNFTLNQTHTKSRIYLHIGNIKIHCSIAKSPNLSTILPVCTKIYKNIEN